MNTKTNRINSLSISLVLMTVLFSTTSLQAEDQTFKMFAVNATAVGLKGGFRALQTLKKRANGRSSLLVIQQIK